MIRVTIAAFRADSETDAAYLLQEIADKLEEGYTSGMVTEISSAMGDVVAWDAEKLCEFCDGEGEITQGKGDNITTKKCFNCNQPDHERDGE